MNWFRSSRWAVAGVAVAALVAWLFASNHCLVMGLAAQAKSSCHDCCRDASPQVPVKPSISCCTTLNADIVAALHAPASKGSHLSGTWVAVPEIPGFAALHPPMLVAISTGPPPISVFTAFDCRKGVPAHAPPGLVG